MTADGSNSLSQLAELFESILNNVYSGIIFCDAEARVVFMNQVYADLLGVDSKAAVGQHISRYFPYSRLPDVIECGVAELGQRCSLKTDTPLLVNRIPIKREGRVEGVILQTIFKDYAAFRDLVDRLNLLKKEVDFYKSGLDSVLSSKFTFDSIIGRSRVMLDLKQMGAKYARTDAPVLILGPTGSGKELFAHAVHGASPRGKGPFVCLNCGGIPRELVESELFGYEAGAFTGAAGKGKPGKIELAHRGTLYLDEIGDLPADAQAVLLRVLETKTLDRLGGVKGIKVDFRLIAATNRDLVELICQGRFREDLYYRLNAMTLRVPRLSERPDDVPTLVNHFLYAMGREEIRFTPAALRRLAEHDWPGNVRELRNVVERVVSLAEDTIIDVEHLPPEIRPAVRSTPGERPPVGRLSDELTALERDLIRRALEENGGNMSRTAQVLGVSRSTLYEKCGKLGLN